MNGDLTPEFVRSKALWIALVLLFILILVGTMYKDWQVTGASPNPWFYLCIPLVSLISSLLAASGLSWGMKQPILPLTTAFIWLVVNSMMQLFENVGKIVYYYVWAYPGILFILVGIPLGVGLTIFLFRRWAKVSWKTAILIAVAQIVSEAVLSGLFVELTGIDTPGS